MVSRFARLVTALAVLCLSRGLAGAAPPSPLTPEQKQQMRQHYERASRAYDVGRFQDAIDEYLKVYEIGADPAMLFNIAQAYRLDERPGEALRYYRMYLERAPNAPNREDVEAKVAELEKGSAPAPAGRAPAAAAPAATSPPPMTPPSLVPSPAPASDPAAPAPAADGAPRAIEARRWVAYSLLAVGAGGLVLAIVEGSVASSKADKIGAESRNGDVFDPAVESNGKRASAIAITSGIIGAAAFTVGGLLFVTQPKREPAATATASLRPRIAPLLGGGLVGAGAAWRY